MNGSDIKSAIEKIPYVIMVYLYQDTPNGGKYTRIDAEVVVNGVWKKSASHDGVEFKNIVDEKKGESEEVESVQDDINEMRNHIIQRLKKTFGSENMKKIKFFIDEKILKL